MACGAGKTTDQKLNAKLNAAIDKQIRQERKKVLSEVKLLLLGTGESGKSTIAKQMKILHMDGFGTEERALYRNIIHSNILEGMATLIERAEDFGYTINNADLLAIASRFKDISQVTPFLSKQVAAGITALWHDPAIQQTFNRRVEYQLPGAVEYLLDHAGRLLTPDVEVNDLDILNARLKTTGVVEINFEADDSFFRVMDVGGQRSERKKWLQCFANVTAVIFCVALNEYDEKLFEDHTVNRMVEAIALFKEIVNNKFFNDPKEPTSVILFLNKKDLFEEKIKRVPLSNLFPDYKGGADPKAGAEFIYRKLVSQCTNKAKTFFYHVTCATDTSNIRVVFDAVRSMILQRNLTEAQVM